MHYFPVPTATPVPTLGPAMARLTEQLAQLTTSHATNMAALNTLAQERAEIDDRETEMREMVGRAADKRAWFDSFRGWIEGVAGFLDEKVPLISYSLDVATHSMLSIPFLKNSRRNNYHFSGKD